MLVASSKASSMVVHVLLPHWTSETILAASVLERFPTCILWRPPETVTL